MKSGPKDHTDTIIVNYYISYSKVFPKLKESIRKVSGSSACHLTVIPNFLQYYDFIFFVSKSLLTHYCLLLLDTRSPERVADSKFRGEYNYSLSVQRNGT